MWECKRKTGSFSQKDTHKGKKKGKNISLRIFFRGFFRKRETH